MSKKLVPIVLVVAGILLMAIVISLAGPPLYAQDGSNAKPSKTPSPPAPVTPVPPVARVFTKTASGWTYDKAQWVVTYTVTFTETEGLAPVGTTMQITDTPGAGLSLRDKSWKATSGIIEVKNNQLIWRGNVKPHLTITYAATTNLAVAEANFVNKATLCCVEKDDKQTPLEISHTQPLRRSYLAMGKRDWRELPGAITQPVNGDFESGPGSGWKQQVNEQPGTLIFGIDQYPVAGPRVGKYYGWVGGVKSQKHVLSQIIKLPYHHSGLKLTFDYVLASLENDCAASGDEMQYGVIGSVQIAPVSLCSARNTFNPVVGHGWVPGELALGPSAGATIEIFFAAALDGDNANSNFLIDNVRLCSTDPDARAEDKCPQ